MERGKNDVRRFAVRTVLMQGPLYYPTTWIRAFTHIFGHADFAHYVGNMSYILLLGPMLEEKYSSGTLPG